MVAANPLTAVSPAIQGTLNGAKAPPLERRQRARVRVHWPLVLFRNSAGPGDAAPDRVETVTQNLSSTGFFCFSQRAFAAGESFICEIIFPYKDHRVSESRLELSVVAVRVEENAVNGQYGIACRIEDYRFAAAAR